MTPISFLLPPSLRGAGTAMIITAESQTLPRDKSPMSPFEISDSNSPLDPGPPPRPRKRPTSGWKLAFFIVLAVGVLFIVQLIAKQFWQLFELAKNPHSGAYRNETRIEDVPIEKRSRVVQPFLGVGEDSFDVMVAVWARNLTGPEERWWWDHESNSTLNNVKTYEELGKPKVYKSQDYYLQKLLETTDTRMELIHAEIPKEFRALKLNDAGLKKVKSATVQLRVPKFTLCNRLVKPNDLLATFAIIPRSSPFALQLREVSSILPSMEKRVPLIPETQAPALSAEPYTQRLLEEAISSSGFAQELLYFKEAVVLPEFGRPGRPFRNVVDTDSDEEDGDEDEEDVLKRDLPIRPKKMRRPNFLEGSTPEILLRTHLRIRNETRLFDRRRFVEKRREMKRKMEDCLDAIESPNVKEGFTRMIERCRKFDFPDEFNQFGTLLRLDMGSNRSEYAYGPNFDVLKTALGPRERAKLPFNRSECPLITDTVFDEGKLEDVTKFDFIETPLKISLTVLSSRRWFLSSVFTHRYEEHAAEEKEYERWKSQDRVELWNGLYGFTDDKSEHPRRRIFIYGVIYVLSFTTTLLNLHYFHDLRSTLALSVPGTVFLAVAYLFDVFAPIAFRLYKPSDSRFEPEGITGWLLAWNTVPQLLIELPLPLLMLKSILHFEVSFQGIRRAPASHEERWSHRQDEGLWKWRMRVLCCLTIIPVYCLVLPHQRQIISTMVPPEPISHAALDRLNKLSRSITSSLRLVGTVSQVCLSYNLNTFAGSYKLTAYLTLLGRLLGLLLYVPELVGRYTYRPALTVQDVLDLGLAVATSGIAWRYPGVEMSEGDESEE